MRHNHDLKKPCGAVDPVAGAGKSSIFPHSNLNSAENSAYPEKEPGSTNSAHPEKDAGSANPMHPGGSGYSAGRSACPEEAASIGSANPAYPGKGAGSANPLARFIQAKAEEIAQLEALEQAGSLPAPFTGPRPSFTPALRQAYGQLQGKCSFGGAASTAALPVIAEYKRASPSRGLIRADLTPEAVAGQYAAAGAACLSVLTEQQYFDGDLTFINRAAKVMERSGGPVLPVLRKDFIFHPLQVRATAATRASALLLIVRLTPSAAVLRHLRELAESYGLEAVVEVFDADDLVPARESGASLIQVNARDLGSFHVDISDSLRLIREFPPRDGETWIAASGISNRDQLAELAEAGFHAALVGSSLMDQPSPGAALRALLEHFNFENI